MVHVVKYQSPKDVITSLAPPAENMVCSQQEVITMDFGFSQVEVIYIYGECKKQLKALNDARAAGVSSGHSTEKMLRSIIQKMERCCPALQHLPD